MEKGTLFTIFEVFDDDDDDDDAMRREKKKENTLFEEEKEEEKEEVPLKLKFKTWQGVATWTWDDTSDVCGICHSPYDACAPDCKYPGDDSPVVWGVCSHAFHLRCITKWLDGRNSEQKCPICRGEWEFKQA